MLQFIVKTYYYNHNHIIVILTLDLWNLKGNMLMKFYDCESNLPFGSVVVHKHLLFLNISPRQQPFVEGVYLSSPHAIAAH